MSTFEERIAKAVTDKLNDGTVEELVSDGKVKRERLLTRK